MCSADGAVPQWLSHSRGPDNAVVAQYMRLGASAVPINAENSSWRVAGPESKPGDPGLDIREVASGCDDEIS